MHLKIGIGSGGGLASYQYFKDCGYDCIDFSLMHTNSCWYTLSKEEAEKRLLQEKAWAKEVGLELHQCHGPWMSWEIYLTEEQRRERMEENKRSLWCASVLGIKNWVIHPIFPFNHDDKGGTMWDESFRINLDFYKELLETAKKYGITICLENVPFPGFGLSEIHRIKEFVDTVNDEHFKICLDTGHVNCFKTRDLGEAVRLCGKDLRVLHVHDNRGWDSHDIPYFGEANWESFYKGLVDIGYQGVFNFETGPRPNMGDALNKDIYRMMVKIARHIMHDDDTQNKNK